MKKVVTTIIGVASFALFSTSAFAYEVEKGDTIGKIADSHELSLEEIIELNPQIQDINLIFPGEEVHTEKEELALYISENGNVEVQQQEVIVQQPVQEEYNYVQSEPEKQQQVQQAQKPEPVQSTPVSTQTQSDGNNWGALAKCESGGNPNVVSSNGLYHGLYQFDAQTWQSVGGSGVASQASASEQTQRAKILYSQRGSQPWPVCGRNL